MCTQSIWVEIITMLYHICYAMVEPSIKIHIYETLCETGNFTSDCSELNSADNTIVLEDSIQKYAANSLVLMKCMRSIPALLIIIFCGAWSDDIGRKLPILFPFIGMLLSLLLYLISYANGVDVFSVLLAGGFLSGLFGEVGLILMAAYSYITDITEQEDRTNRLGRLVAMSFFGQFIGSLILSIMIKVTLVRNVFIFAAVICGLSIIVVITLLQDSLTDKSNSAGKTSVIVFRSTYLMDTWQVITKPRAHKKRMYIILILTCIALHQACLWGEFDITMLYVRHGPLWWNSAQYGYYLAGGYLASGLGTILLLPILSGYFKVVDASLAMAAVAFKVVQVIWASFSIEDWMVYLAIPLMVVSSMLVPALKSLLSKLISEDEIGKIFGLAAFGETLSGLLGAFMFTAVYGASVHTWKGIAFILEAAVNIGVFGVILWMAGNIAKNYKSGFTEDLGPKQDPLTVQVDNNTAGDYPYETAEPEEHDKFVVSHSGADAGSPSMSGAVGGVEHTDEYPDVSRKSRASVTSYMTQSVCSDSDESEYRKSQTDVRPQSYDSYGY